ncbi:MAG: hypothetical protein K8L97_13335 [Anaerolineae bacterium]|nr:hypothetical protein [Anaerolineae bacterium]
MADLQNAQVAFITVFAVGFLSAIYSLIILISGLRRLRGIRHQRALEAAPESEAMLPPPTAELIRQTSEFAPIARPKPIPEPFRIPIQKGTPEQVILSIEPLDGPNTDQRNVQKLIEFLKQEVIQQAS